uniref:Uncharacterized protein n=1 Tax=Caenorhabditis japonica TaxID=281687 RepID=A0A8R1EUS0_CAEJA
MAGFNKIMKSSSNGTSIFSKANIVKSSVTRQKYYMNRRLVTRHDVRSRMSVWNRIFSWCGSARMSAESEAIFTMRS